MERLPMHAETFSDVFRYYQTRALQLASRDFVWSQELHPICDEKVFVTFFHLATTGQRYGSFYIVKSARGQGLWSRALQALGECPIVTVEDCDIEAFCLDKQIPHVVVTGAFDTPGYHLVEEFYRDRVAARSGVFLMNHIDEGLAVLNAIGASEDSKEAFCLHPLLQGDRELENMLDVVCATCSAKQVALAMEYRQFANGWLSAKVSFEGGVAVFDGLPSTGPLPEVRHMLIADKVQNYKDFILYHKGTHARSAELEQYFEKWFDTLGSSECDKLLEWLCAISPRRP